jgi:prepilin-type N-terminal cleavage/methylation domain-containing protein
MALCKCLLQSGAVDSSLQQRAGFLMKILKHWRHCRKGAFTLIEVLISLGVFALVSVGIVYGYVQSNRMAEFEAYSLAAQSFASEGAEQARDANWRPRDTPITNGPGTMDELPPCTNVIGGTNLILDIPSGGLPTGPCYVTNIITVTTVGNNNPPLRQIRSDAIWMFAPTGSQLYTNTTILLRAPDQ